MHAARLVILLTTLGCNPTDPDGEDTAPDEDETDTDAGSDLDADTDGGADTDTDAEWPGFTPYAVGFELFAGYDGDANITEFSLLGTDFPPYVIITLADLEYFSLPEDEREGHFCEVVALFNGSNAAYEGYTPGSTTGDLWDPHGPAVELWGAWVGDLSVLDLADETRSLCVDLDPAVWDGGTPMTTFDGMRFGAGIGELTDYSASGWTAETLDVFGDSMMTQFIAVRRADGDFHAYDWNTAFLWEMNDDGIVKVEGDLLVPVPVSGGTQAGYMAGASFWYDDLVNLDLGALD